MALVAMNSFFMRIAGTHRLKMLRAFAAGKTLIRIAGGINFALHGASLGVFISGFSRSEAVSTESAQVDGIPPWKSSFLLELEPVLIGLLS